MPAATLPSEWKQQLIRLRFAEPVPRHMKQEFLRIRLTQDGKSSGEADFHRSEIVQPHRVGGNVCKVCWKPLWRRPTDGKQMCVSPTCSERRLIVEAGPTRGMVKVGTRLEVNGKVVVDCNLPGGMIDGCILTLDRRYDQRVLDDVVRAAREIAEQCGFRVV